MFEDTNIEISMGAFSTTISIGFYFKQFEISIVKDNFCCFFSYTREIGTEIVWKQRNKLRLSSEL